MSSPHVAGLGALLKQLHPDWSPMAIKSALMTTGYDVLTTGPNTNPVVIFRQGAGHVQPNAAADPGLVFDSRLQRLARLPVRHRSAAGVVLHRRDCRIDPSDLNVRVDRDRRPGRLQTVTRR